MDKEYKLTIELVPESCWYVNLRKVLKPSDWDKVRRDAYARANGKCMICGRYTRRLEAHEKWNYDEGKGLQKLEDVVALCHSCHEVKHIARTQLMGRGAEAMEHFMKVNGCSQMDYHAALGEANEWLRRTRNVEWTTDISWLKNKFNI